MKESISKMSNMEQLVNEIDLLKNQVKLVNINAESVYDNQKMPSTDCEGKGEEARPKPSTKIEELTETVTDIKYAVASIAQKINQLSEIIRFGE